MTKPTTTTRLRITECKAAYLTKTGKKITNRELAWRVFIDAPDMSQKQMDEAMSRWDRGGPECRGLNKARLKRLARALKCTPAELTGE